MGIYAERWYAALVICAVATLESGWKFDVDMSLRRAGGIDYLEV